MSALLIIGILFGVSYGQKASATVPGVNQLVSQDSSGTWANANSTLSLHSVSGDGRYVVFTSAASNLVPGDTNAHSDVFVRDTQTNTTTLVDVSDTGVQAALGAGSPAISYDGRYVVFSAGNNLVTGVTGATLFERDLVSNTTKAVSVTAAGVGASASSPDVNADGRYVTFVTQSSALLGVTTSRNQIAIKDMLTGAVQWISDLNGTVGYGGDDIFPTIDCDGQTVAFLSNADLVNPTTHDYQYYSYDLFYVRIGWSGHKLYNATYNGNPISQYQLSPAQISCNGNRMAYVSNNGVAEFDRLTGNFSSITYSGLTLASISDDGRYVAFLSKSSLLGTTYPNTYAGTNYDAYIWDIKTGTSQLLSFTALGNKSGLIPALPYSGGAGMISISPDGSTVAYTYATPNASNTNGELMSGVHTGVQDVYTSKTGY